MPIAGQMVACDEEPGYSHLYLNTPNQDVASTDYKKIGDAPQSIN